jgi:DNA-binding response OmpR family regulator
MAKILIVDDDENILDALSLVLADEGYTIDSLTDGSKITERIRKFSPDVILLDVLLSGIDGRDICRKLKSDPKTKNIPVIMISAHPSAGRSTLESGANAFLPKPFGIDELYKTVSKYVPN